MKETPFTKYHIELGAKMVEFAGYNMPIEYKGINSEHISVRTKAGLFDVSHMGEIYIKGKTSLDFLQYVTANNVSILSPGKIQYSYFPNENGGIVDDLLVYCISKYEYLLVVNASNIRKDWNFLTQYSRQFGLRKNIDIINKSDETAQVALQGPLSAKILNKITGGKISDIAYYTFIRTDIKDIKNAIISATGYTGAGGYEIYVDTIYAEQLWEYLCEAGNPEGMVPAGLGARDTLRLEMGYCLYGNDLNDSTSPWEAGLGWITKLTDKKEFVGKQKIAQLKSEEIKRKLIGFEMTERAIPRKGYKITNENGIPIGTVTSGTMSPILKKGIGMGYVETSFIDKYIYIPIRNKLAEAEIIKLPFVKR